MTDSIALGSVADAYMIAQEDLAECARELATMIAADWRLAGHSHPVMIPRRRAGKILFLAVALDRAEAEWEEELER